MPLRANVLDACPFHFEVLNYCFWQGDMITVLKQDPSGWWQVCWCMLCVCVLVGVVLSDFEWAE